MSPAPPHWADLSRSLDLCVRQPQGPCPVRSRGRETRICCQARHAAEKTASGTPTPCSCLAVSQPAPPAALPACPPARLPWPRPVTSSCLRPPPPARPAQFTDGRYWIYSPRHRRLRAVTLSSSGTVSDHGRPPGSQAPPRTLGSREPQVLVPLPPRRDMGKTSLRLRSATLARVGRWAVGVLSGRVLPAELGVMAPAGTLLGLPGTAWPWQGRHLTPSPQTPLPLVPALLGQGRVTWTAPTCSDFAANSTPRASVP